MEHKFESGPYKVVVITEEETHTTPGKIILIDLTILDRSVWGPTWLRNILRKRSKVVYHNSYDFEQPAWRRKDFNHIITWFDNYGLTGQYHSKLILGVILLIINTVQLRSYEKPKVAQVT